MSFVVAKDVKKSYKLGKNNYVHALRGTSVEIKKSEFVAIMGPSGSGKSTLMHILGCLDYPESGRVIINDKDTSKLSSSKLTKIRQKKIGFIFQGFNLIPTLTALENVSLAGEYAGMSRKERLAKAKEMLALVGLAERVRHKPSELSGGEQQRVSIARALLNEPDIIMADEPTGDLDSTTSKEIMTTLRDLNHKHGQTFLIVTHDPEVGKACDRIIKMKDGVVES